MNISGVVTQLDAAGFRREFKDYGRDKQFSNCGLDALFENLENLADEMGEPVELDVIALCCDWSEYEDLAEARSEYGIDLDDIGLDAADDPDADEIHAAALEYFQDQTTVIEADNGRVLLRSY